MSDACALRKRVPGARFLAVGSVKGRRLAFHKLSSDKSSKCDIPLSDDPTSVVHGVLYEVPEAELTALDSAEGVGSGYIPGAIDVIRGDGTSVSAIVYLAAPSAIQPQLAPYTWYHAFVVAGAREHGIPLDYISEIERVVAIPDLDTARAARAARVLNASSNATGSA